MPAGDGSTDDTTAFANAIAAVDEVIVPAGTYIVSQVVIPSNKKIVTEGFATVIKQKSGTAANTRIVRIEGSGVSIDDISIEGQLNQAGDTTGEQNHAIFVYSASGAIDRISIGNVRAANIRGDAVMVGGGTNAVRQVSVGHIYANNCYRNGLTIYSNVQGLDVVSIYENACGQQVLDIEPDSADPVRGVRIGHIRGRYAQFSGASTVVQGVVIGSMDMDPANGANSTPNNAYANNGDCIAIRGAYVTIGHLKANGYNGQVVQPASGGAATAQLHVGLAEVTNCCLTDTTYYSFFEGGGSGAVEYRIDRVKATTTIANHRVFGGCFNSHMGKAEVSLVASSSLLRSCTDCSVKEVVATVASGVGGDILIGCTRCYVGGGSIAGNSLDGFGSTRCILQNIDATLSAGPFISSTECYALNSRVGGTSYLLTNFGNTVWRTDGVFATPSTVHATGFVVGANQVVGARGAAVADASGGATVDSQARTAINTVLARLRAHGLIAT